MNFKKNLRMLLAFLLLTVFLLTGCAAETEGPAPDTDNATVESETDNPEMPVDDETPEPTQPPEIVEDSLNNFTDSIAEDGTYTSKEDVAAYIYEYGHLPSNFITKKEAKALGWVSSEGNLDEVAPGMSIGGDYFGNYEGNLPEADGRDYYECDIDFDGTYRNSKRIVYSNDGLIYYTEDHYETFELLYGEE